MPRSCTLCYCCVCSVLLENNRRPSYLAKNQKNPVTFSQTDVVFSFLGHNVLGCRTRYTILLISAELYWCISSVSDLRQFAHRRNVEEGDFVVASFVSSREPQNSLVMLTHGYGSNNAECESAEHWPFFLNIVVDRFAARASQCCLLLSQIVELTNS